MPNSKFNIWTHVQLVLKLLLIVMLLQSCKSYQKSSMMAEAAKIDSKGAIKITMHNGEKFLYENIEFTENQYYGVFVENEERIKIPLNQKEIKSVQVLSKKASFMSKFLGVTAVAAAIVFGGAML